MLHDVITASYSLALFDVQFVNTIELFALMTDTQVSRVRLLLWMHFHRSSRNVLMR